MLQEAQEEPKAIPAELETQNVCGQMHVPVCAHRLVSSVVPLVLSLCFVSRVALWPGACQLD